MVEQDTFFLQNNTHGNIDYTALNDFKITPVISEYHNSYS